MTAGEAVLAYLRTQIEVLRRHDPSVRLDVPDGVHQMRVAARRLRSALQAFGRVIERDSTRGLTAELKWVAGELGAARDAEVMAERFGENLAELPDELKLGPVQAAVTRAFERRAAEARETALAALDSDRYLALQEAIDALLEKPPLTKRAGRPARQELPRSVRRANHRLIARMAEADRQPRGERRDLAVHETRKAAKRLRYATEAAERVVGKPATRLRKSLKKLQTLLGEHQDSVVSRTVLRELAAQAQLDGGNGFTYGLLYGGEAARAHRVEDALHPAWDRTQTRARKWLAR